MLREETDKYIRLRRCPLWVVLHYYSYQVTTSSVFWTPPQRFQTPAFQTHCGACRILLPKSFEPHLEYFS